MLSIYAALQYSTSYPCPQSSLSSVFFVGGGEAVVWWPTDACATQNNTNATNTSEVRSISAWSARYSYQPATDAQVLLKLL